MNNDVYTVERQFWLAALGRADWSKNVGVWASWACTLLFVWGLVWTMLNINIVIAVLTGQGAP